jgi:TseV toxin immunity protein TsiV
MHIEVANSEGNLIVRDSMVAAFFTKRPYPELAKAYGDVFELWLDQTPDDAKRWAIIGPHGDEYKPFKELARARAEFNTARAKTRNICALKIGGPQRLNPDYKFTFVGVRDLAKNRANMLEIRSPTSEVEGTNVDRYVESVHRVAQRLPFDSGYASPALTHGAQGHQAAFAKEARKWAFRHPGFDMPNNEGTAAGIAQKLRGAYWLTFLGPWALEQVGGQSALRKALPEDVQMQSAGVGVMLRVGKHPELGDVNKGHKLPVLRAMAKVLEAASRFDDAFLDNIFVDETQRARWERRHLD